MVVVEDQVVGHNLFSPISIGQNPLNKGSVGFASLAVAPEFQRKGIGSVLVRKGAEMEKAMGWENVIVL